MDMGLMGYERKFERKIKAVSENPQNKISSSLFKRVCKQAYFLV